MISANGGLPAHRYTFQVTPRWPRGSEPASQMSHAAQDPPTAMTAHAVYAEEEIQTMQGRTMGRLTDMIEAIQAETCG